MQKDSVAAPSSAPVELRMWCKRLTIEDVERGIQGIRLPDGPVVNGSQRSALFNPPVLEWRFKQKIHVDGKVEFEWSPWLTVQIVAEQPTFPADS